LHINAQDGAIDGLTRPCRLPRVRSVASISKEAAISQLETMIDSIRYPIRIISDIHLGNRASLVLEPEKVAALFQGVGTVVLNGDTFDHRRRERGKAPNHPIELFENLAWREGAELVMIAGNHDPDCSTVYHLDLAHGQILVTHGDVLYPEIAPWSHFAAQFREMIRKELEELEHPSLHTLEHLLATNKSVARQILIQPHFYFPTNEGFIRHLLRYLWPPVRILRILGSWQRLPVSAAELAEDHRPQARFIIVGHTHFPGVWNRRGRCIINTGSFLPLLGRRLVDIHEDRVEVRKIRRSVNAFHPGRLVKQYALIAG
jgi:predicted phosphodiesterase